MIIYQQYWRFVKYHSAKDRVAVHFKSLCMSSSIVVFGVILNFSTRTLRTFGEINAGSFGPRVILCISSLRRVSNTRTAFCSYYAMLYEIGASLTSVNPSLAISPCAMTISENESLHCPASSTLGIPSMSPRLSLL